MLRDTYGSFWCGVGSSWFLYVIFVACIYTLNVSWFTMDGFEHRARAQFGIHVN